MVDGVEEGTLIGMLQLMETLNSLKMTSLRLTLYCAGDVNFLHITSP
jgi:hypothetical protein